MSPRVALVLETWNLAATLERVAPGTSGMTSDVRRIAAPLAEQLTRLAPQLAGTAIELLITHAGIPIADQEALGARFDRVGDPVRWITVPPTAGYYEHKNLGFAATAADVVAFLDGDTVPAAGWLAAITSPLVRGEARVVAGATSYAGDLGVLANALDFPYFDPANRRFATGDRRPRGAGEPRHVQNLMSNNVAFARDVLSAHPFPFVPTVFHGQCQLLALELRAAGIAIRYVPEAHVTHDWPDDLAHWLAVRLLKGADFASLLPRIVATHVPRLAPAVARLGAAPVVALIAARGLLAIPAALRTTSRLRSLGRLAALTAVDATGAIARRRVYARYGLTRSGPGASQSGHFWVTVAASQDSQANATMWWPGSPNSASAVGLGRSPSA